MPTLRKRVGGRVVKGRREKSPDIVEALSPSLTAARVNCPVVTAKGPTTSEVGASGENVKISKMATKRPSPPVEKEAGVKKPRTKFPDRLLWKMKHYTMPSTSTPKRDPRSQKVTKHDIETAFGFDDSYEAVAEYSTLLSPIAHASPKGIIPPAPWKVNPLTQRNAGCATAPTSADPTSSTHGKCMEDEAVIAPVVKKIAVKKVQLKSKSSVKKIAPTTTSASTSYKKSVKAPLHLDTVTTTASASCKKSVKVPLHLDTVTTTASTSCKKSVKAPLHLDTVTTTASTSCKKSVKAPLHLDTVTTTASTSCKKSVKASQHLEWKTPLFKSKLASGKVNEDHETGTSPFSQLLHRLNDEETAVEKEPDCELFVDPKKIVRTYASRRRVNYSEDRDPETEYDFVPKPTADEEVMLTSTKAKHQDQQSKTVTKKNKVPKSRTKKEKKDDEDLNEKWSKWLEEKNKEFEEVSRTELVVEKSFSD